MGPHPQGQKEPFTHSLTLMSLGLARPLMAALVGAHEDLAHYLARARGQVLQFWPLQHDQQPGMHTSTYHTYVLVLRSGSVFVCASVCVCRKHRAKCSMLRNSGIVFLDVFLTPGNCMTGRLICRCAEVYLHLRTYPHTLRRLP